MKNVDGELGPSKLLEDYKVGDWIIINSNYSFDGEIGIIMFIYEDNHYRDFTVRRHTPPYPKNWHHRGGKIQVIKNKKLLEILYMEE